jgi:uncharacterized membrane protein
MRHQRLTACSAIGTLLLLALLLFPAQTVQCQNYYEYDLKIRGDGAAVFTITQFAGASAPVDSWESFQNRVFDLVDAAANLTHRPMAVDEKSLQINTTIASQSQTTEYSFVWLNFSSVGGREFSLGDVFGVSDFFGRLYGDAALELGYPADFVVQSVSPPPYERVDLAQTLRWSRTQDLTSNTVSITLTSNTSNETNNAGLGSYGLVILAAVSAVALIALGFYVFKRRGKNNKQTTQDPPKTTVTDTEEDKVTKILKSHGGTMRQSQVTEETRFSKAKTSQLLTTLEKSGNITRYKKGRDKIVTLNERVKGE